MNIGLFALLAGFLLPLALVIRLGVLLAGEAGRERYHPVTLVLWTELLLAAVPVVALGPTVWTVTSGRGIEDGVSLLDYAATGWGLLKLAISVAAVLLADVALPRVYDQLVLEPTSAAYPTRHYLLRDLGVLAICLGLACAASAG